MYPGAKRLFDLLSASFALIITAPVQIIAALAIRLTMGNPVFFRQRRVGLANREFDLLKFRTMHPEGDFPEGTPPAARVTPVGRILRSTSIDELPSLINVLRGEISVIGPRPLPVRYLPRYSADQARRHEVRPGITGLAQVSGRNTLGWPERFKLDVWYVDNLSLTLDLKILARTILVVLTRSGVNESKGSTMHEFKGDAT